MFTYYLCDDNDTIYRIWFSIKQEEKEHYLSLLDNYLTELVFIEENELKKLVDKELIERENKESIYNENGLLSLEKIEILNIEKIEDYLPFVITIKAKKYCFLRPYTIFMLISLLSDDISRSNNPLTKKIYSLLGPNRYYYVDFESIYKLFFDESGEFLKEKHFDYNSLYALFGNLDVDIELRYSANELRCFWAGDDAERASADGIVNDAILNEEMLKKLPSNFFPFDERQRILKR